MPLTTCNTHKYVNASIFDPLPFDNLAILKYVKFKYGITAIMTL